MTVGRARVLVPNVGDEELEEPPRRLLAGIGDKRRNDNAGRRGERRRRAAKREIAHAQPRVQSASNGRSSSMSKDVHGRSPQSSPQWLRKPVDGGTAPESGLPALVKCGAAGLRCAARATEGPCVRPQAFMARRGG